MCKVAYPQMEKYKYKPALSAGVVATGGTLGILIPPSISFVIYSILTEESIGKLFIAGIIPGIIQALLLMLVVFVWTRVDPAAGPSAEVKVSIKEKLKSLAGTGEILFLFLLVMGGMFLGWFSANEAAGVGAAGAVLVASLRKMLTVKQFWEATRETLKITAMITLLISGGIVFAGFMSISRLPFALADFVLALHAPPMLIMLAIIIIYFICGALMEMTSVLIVTIPIFYRLIIALGFDPIWFGVVVVILIEIALITPPVGLNVWVISGMLPHVPMGQIFKGAMIILIGSVASLVIVLFFPQVALFLPHLMK
jgi:C4-dicarboxylate transporter, DctM subunit